MRRKGHIAVDILVRSFEPSLREWVALSPGQSGIQYRLPKEAPVGP